MKTSEKTTPYGTTEAAGQQLRRAGARHVLVDAEMAGVRLDKLLVRLLPGLPKSRLFRLIRKGEVRVNGKRAGPELRLQDGDDLRIPPIHERAEPDSPRGPPRELVASLAGRVIYEDERVLVIDKPAGIAVHGGSGVSFGVIEALRAARPGKTLELVHRLDRDTSGCLVVARRASVLRQLHAMLRETGFEKRYLTLVRGKWDLGQKRIDVPLRTDLRVGGERTVKAHASGKAAVSRFRPVQFFGRIASLMEVTIDTGRTHQIRVHAQYAGHPVAGDEKYGDSPFNAAMRELGLTRMFLHAHALSFPWPGGAGELSVNTPLPEELSAVIDRLAASTARRKRRQGTR